jgi:transcriptional regulator with XRE-family HTH domain
MITQKTTTRQVLSKNLRRFRLEKGLSQEELANLAGLHRTYIGSVERGERNISIDNIECLAKALGCQVVDLLRGDKQ